MPFPLDSDEIDRIPATEDSKERGYADDEFEEDLGESETLDEEDEDFGDVADEGPGHRG